MSKEIKKYDYLKFSKSIIIEYLKLQKKYSNIYGKDKTIVLMQVGSFHEAYCTSDDGFDLFRLSNLLNTIVSKKNKKIKEVSVKNPYMLGFPTIATPKFIKILIDNGFHIIKIDQVTDPPNPKRAITGIFSPGTYIEEVNTEYSNNILSIYLEEIKQLNGSGLLYIGLSLIDLSIGNSIVHEIYASKEDDKYSLDETLKFINNFNPCEIIINFKNLKTISDEEIINYLELEDKKYLINELNNKEFENIKYQNSYLLEIFKMDTYLSPIEEINLEKINNGRLSYILLLKYCQDQNRFLLNNLQYPEFYQESFYLHLGNNASSQLNLFQNKCKDNTKYNSLIDIINYTSTAMGRRMLKFNLGNPIYESKSLEQRYELIQEILKKKKYNEYKIILKEIIDIERLHRKLSLQTLHPFDFVNLNDSYKMIIDLYKKIKNTKLQNIFTSKMFSELEEYMSFYNNLFNIDEMSKYILNDITGSFYKKGIHKNIDELENKINKNNKIIESIRDKLETFIENRKKDYFNNKSDKTNMIQINYNDRDKYYLVVTLKRGKQIEKKFKQQKVLKIDNYEIKFEDFSFKNQTSTMKINCSLIDSLSDKIIVNLEQLKSQMKNLYLTDLDQIYKNYKTLFIGLSKVIGMIDFLNSGAICAIENKYSCPKIIKNNKSFISVKNMRHPIIEKIISSSYIPHSLSLGLENDGILLYGLNSAGKSSLMKAIGLNIILAQIGYFVPCSKMEFNPYQSIFTRIIGTDNIFKGLSSFALELVELKAILKRSGSNTLVLADEVCKGTEHKSALIIVTAMIKMLANTGTSFISATHLHELIKIKEINELKNLGIFHLNVSYEKNNIVFHRILQPGNGTEEYGLDFAKYIIKDKDFIKIASNIKDNIDKGNIFKTKPSRYNSDILMDKCDICSSKNKLETHHIEFQKNCDKHGFILKEEKSHIHKNHKSNLVVLCEKCHDKIHNNLIIIEGYKETIKGNILQYKIINKSSKKKNNKFNNEIIEFVEMQKNKPNISQRKVKKLTEERFNKKISTSTISKIWKGTYI